MTELATAAFFTLLLAPIAYANPSADMPWQLFIGVVAGAVIALIGVGAMWVRGRR